MSINRGLDKDDLVHIHNRILLSHKTHETMPFATTSMDLEIIILSEVSQIKINNIYHLYLETNKNVTKRTYLQNRN